MSRYIDADKITERLTTAINMTSPDNKITIGYLEYLISLILQAPTADVEEVRHGKWKEWNYPNEEYVECSACFTRYYQDDLLMGNEDYPEYCPGCGARMDGGAK